MEKTKEGFKAIKSRSPHGKQQDRARRLHQLGEVVFYGLMAAVLLFVVFLFVSAAGM